MKLLRIGVLSATIVVSVSAFAQADWTQRFPATSPPARFGAAMAQMGSNVVLFGGSGSNGLLNDTWIWNGTNWTHITSFGAFGTGPSPSPRRSAMMAYHEASGKVVLFGGGIGSAVSPSDLSDTWIFQITASKLLNRIFFEWIQVSPSSSPPAREAGMLEYDPGSGRIVLAGGLNFTVGLLQDSWSFNVSSQSWTPLPNSPAPRIAAAMAKCSVPGKGSPDRIQLFGGGGPFNGTPTQCCTELDDSWVYLDEEFNGQFIFPPWGQVVPASHPQGRDHAGMAYYPVSNQDVLYGGALGGGPLTDTTPVFNDTWNASCGSWTLASPAHNPGKRSGMAMATGPSSFNLVLFGGRLFANGQVTAETNETWTWGRRVACLPTNESELPVGSEITCQFDVDFGNEPDIEFAGWNAFGFAPPARGQTTATFHTEAPGPASITANWTDPDGAHSETLDYIVTIPH
jgi:Galactose oxidase, central domain